MKGNWLKTVTMILAVVLCISCACAETAVLKLPPATRQIMEYAFYRCSAREAVLPEGVEMIGAYAFADCGSLEQVNIPASVHTIGHHAFSGSNGLSSVTVPDSVTEIGSQAFPTGTVIRCGFGSAAHRYALSSGNPVELTGGTAKDLDMVCNVTECSVDTIGQWQASASFAVAPYKYKFTLYKDGKQIATTSYLSKDSYTHVFEEAGAYQLKVSCMDDDGESMSLTSETVHVTLEPFSTEVRLAADTPEKLIISEEYKVDISFLGGTGPYTCLYEIRRGGETIATNGDFGSSFGGEDDAFRFITEVKEQDSRNVYSGTLYLKFDEAGSYDLLLQAKDALGTIQSAETLHMDIQPRPIEILSVTSGMTSAQTYDQLTWKMATVGGTDGYYYAYSILKDGETTYTSEWKKAEDAETEIEYVPELPGTYAVSMMVSEEAEIMDGQYTVREEDIVRENGAGPEISVALRALEILSVTSNATHVKLGDSITWTTEAIGGYKPYTYRFSLYTEDELTDSRPYDADNTYSYVPEQTGNFSVRAYVRDTDPEGRKTVQWPEDSDYGCTVEVYEEIRIESVTDEGTVEAGYPIRWNVVTAGGYGTVTVTYEVVQEDQTVAEGTATDGLISFTPIEAGEYQVKVTAADADDERAESVSTPVTATEAQTAPEDVFTYTVSDKKAVITAYTGESAAVIIPDTLGGTPVGGIGSNVFKNNQVIGRIEMPDSLTSIGSYAFQNATNLQQVAYSSALTTIGEYAFAGCTAIKMAELPDSVTSIGSRAFYNCTA
ncbi:MAG: leucine-rich repeat protein, partial [Clostridia bacterium]|nr:leucine-rich repeat protein [Clostridia bacterium]